MDKVIGAINNNQNLKYYGTDIKEIKSNYWEWKLKRNRLEKARFEYSEITKSITVQINNYISTGNAEEVIKKLVGSYDLYGYKLIPSKVIGEELGKINNGCFTVYKDKTTVHDLEFSNIAYIDIHFGTDTLDNFLTKVKVEYHGNFVPFEELVEIDNLSGVINSRIKSNQKGNYFLINMVRKELANDVIPTSFSIDSYGNIRCELVEKYKIQSVVFDEASYNQYEQQTISIKFYRNDQIAYCAGGDIALLNVPMVMKKLLKQVLDENKLNDLIVEIEIKCSDFISSYKIIDDNSIEIETINCEIFYINIEHTDIEKNKWEITYKNSDHSIIDVNGVHYDELIDNLYDDLRSEADKLFLLYEQLDVVEFDECFDIQFKDKEIKLWYTDDTCEDGENKYCSFEYVPETKMYHFSNEKDTDNFKDVKDAQRIINDYCRGVPTLTIKQNGDKEWLKNGKLHREDGPAIEYLNGGKRWYIDGKFIPQKIDISMKDNKFFLIKEDSGCLIIKNKEDLEKLKKFFPKS